MSWSKFWRVGLQTEDLCSGASSRSANSSPAVLVTGPEDARRPGSAASEQEVDDDDEGSQGADIGSRAPASPSFSHG